MEYMSSAPCRPKFQWIHHKPSEDVRANDGTSTRQRRPLLHHASSIVPTKTQIAVLEEARRREGEREHNDLRGGKSSFSDPGPGVRGLMTMLMMLMMMMIAVPPWPRQRFIDVLQGSYTYPLTPFYTTFANQKGGEAEMASDEDGPNSRSPMSVLFPR
jgi:hypothetical protein